MQKRTVAAIAACGAIAAVTTALSATAQSAPGVGADCPIITSISSNAVSTLAPMQSLPAAKAQQARDAYVAQVQSKASGLTTAQGRADVQAYANAVRSANSMADSQSLLQALTKLQTDCS